MLCLSGTANAHADKSGCSTVGVCLRPWARSRETFFKHIKLICSHACTFNDVLHRQRQLMPECQGVGR